MLNAKTVAHVGWDSNAYEGEWCEDFRRTEWAYKIQIELVDGSRFYLDQSLLTSETHDFEEIKAIQDRRVARIEKHLADGGYLKEAHWYPTDPAYGSEAYQHLDDEGEFKAREEKEFRLNGR